jgi:uncharacterized iron-regulated protein
MNPAPACLRLAPLLLWLILGGACVAAPMEIAAVPGALAQSMQGRRIVLLGEVHDNAALHTLRAAALRQWLLQGARPAMVFEQFDREQQADIDRARRERPKDADYLIAQARGHNDWHWESYRPYVALALEYDLPIVAGNLARGDAMRVATQDWSAVFDATTRRELQLDALPADYRRRQEEAIAIGHCNLLPPDALPARARAQIARDIVMARSIRPYAKRGVVLLAGNGHVERDIGVPFWLTEDERRAAISIGLLEREEDGSTPDAAKDFDVYAIVARAQRADPCEELMRKLAPAR